MSKDLLVVVFILIVVVLSIVYILIRKDLKQWCYCQLSCIGTQIKNHFREDKKKK